MTVVNLVVDDLELNCYGQSFETLTLETVIASAPNNMTLIGVDICNRMASPSVLHSVRPGPTFSRSQFVTVNFSETVRAGEKLAV